MDARRGLCRESMRVCKIQACEMMFSRRVEGVTRLDRVRNEDVRRSLGQEAVVANGGIFHLMERTFYAQGKC